MERNQKRRLLDRLPFWLRLPVRWLFKTLLFVLIVNFCGALFYIFLSLQLEIDEVAHMPERTLILDRHDHELTSLHGQNRRPISHLELPPLFVDALLAREDSRFFEHPGVDLLGVARAMRRNLVDRSFSEGASTISMQLARNTFELRQMSLHRKLLEIALALRIEKRYSKHEILTHYLNRIYFGSGCYGLQEAALTYFGRPAAELNQGESAMLAGIIRGPHIFSPFRNLEAAMNQRDQVIKRLCDEGKLDPTSAQKVRKLPIRLVKPEDRESERSYALQWVRRELNQLLDQGEISSGGLIVETTLDLAQQTQLEHSIAEQFYRLEHSSGWPHPIRQEGVHEDYLQCAAIRCEKTGEVRAVIGGRNPEESFFNRALMARRDLGNAFAPFVNAAAAERGKLLIRGLPVATGRQIGVDEVARISARLGLEGGRRDEDLYRGAITASPRQFTRAIASLANQGQRPDLFVIKQIRHPNGEVVFTRNPKFKRVISEIAAEDSLDFPPFQNCADFDILIESSFSKRDYWAARLDRKDHTVTCFWIGFDDPKNIGDHDKLKAMILNLCNDLH